MAYARVMHAPDPDGGWEQLFWLVFRRTSNPIALLDDQRRIIDINDAGLALVDRSHAEVLGLDITGIVLPAERADAERQWEAFMRSGAYTGSRDLLRPDGSTVEVDFAARLAVVGGRRLAIYVILSKSGLPTGAWPSARRNRSAASALTKREREVVTLIAMGLETDEIAAELHVSPETVRTHVRNAMSKLGAHTRAQLVAIVLTSDRTIHVPHVGERVVNE
jgi:PAS domain S-box-containing protein